MNQAFTLLLSLIATCIFAQKNPTEEAQPIVQEGKLLYKLEMASWHGTDLFLANYPNKNNIGGYFSYSEKDTTKCVFFSRTEKPKIIGTIAFDSTYNINNTTKNFTERDFTNQENDLYQIRKIALTELQTNEDKLFKFYSNTNPNIIPLIKGKEKKVYILTASKQHGVIIFGNDYLLTFNKKNKLVAKKQLHQNIISVEYGKLDKNEEMIGAIHNHSSETGDFMTATDICTLMLYSKYTKWKTHNVISEKYLNIWNCETNQLTVIPRNVFENHDHDTEEKKK